MEVRILKGQDTRRYIELRTLAASECPWSATGNPKEEMFLLADRATAGTPPHPRQDTIVWGVNDGYLLAGTLAVSRQFNLHADNHLWLWGLYVRPRYRGTPASRLLMDAMLAWCRKIPTDERLLGSCHGSNQRARLFLTRWGFQVVALSEYPMAIQGVEAGGVLVERERGQQ